MDLQKLSEDITSILIKHRTLHARERILSVIIEEEFTTANAVAVLKIRPVYENAAGNAPATFICKIINTNTRYAEELIESAFYQGVARKFLETIIPVFFGVFYHRKEFMAILLFEDLNQEYNLLTVKEGNNYLLQLAALIAGFQAEFWGTQEKDNYLYHGWPDNSVARMAAIGISNIHLNQNFLAAKHACEKFIGFHQSSLNEKEILLLKLLAENWLRLAVNRAADINHLTLLHGDLHLMGNVFVSKNTMPQSFKFIDWAQICYGLGPHDLMYMLIALETDERKSRDTKILRHYFDRLKTNGVSDYSWDQCLWDYRFSTLSSIYQCVFQNSLTWFKRTAHIVEVWNSTELLKTDDPPENEL